MRRCPDNNCLLYFSREVEARMRDLNRTAIETGAAQGIGRRTAELLTKNGFAVALVDLQSTTHICNALRESGAATLDLQGDISDENTLRNLVARVEHEWVHIDLLVNNAGIGCISPAEQTSGQQFRRVLEVNLVAPFML